MDDVTEALREAFEGAGYPVEGVDRNRTQVRVSLREEGAEAARLREVLFETVDEEAVLGLDIAAQGSDADAGVGTVVSFTYRG